MAKYFMQEMPDMKKEGETLLYPRMEITGTCETDELVEASIKGSTFNRGEVRGALDLITGTMARFMAEGRSVRIDGIGLFTPTVKLRKGKERENIEGNSPRRNAASIEIGGINFRADRTLINETNTLCNLERGSGVKKCRRPKTTAEERLNIVKKYLEENPFITVSDYSKMVELNRTTAAKELKAWAADTESGIAIKGLGTHKVYINAGK
ncbi:HU family DNA-binding protein [Bacteroides caecigallinarum]|uniref:HU family DNA-binding protein n=1 Tax=Bacteroides caecigallinarum TaxID=1411144 RepID=UPI001EF5E30A|nr:HU family DNA-binding protein [Bacteroides caecigallinarum]